MIAQVALDGNLFELATRLDSLERAWERVRHNAGCAGADGVTVERFAEHWVQRLQQLQGALREGSYRPAALRLIDIPKDDGGLRRLAVPAVIDRVAQTAVANALTPVIEPELEEVSFAYRRGRSVQQAVQTIARHRERGFTWVVEGDIERYFDRIPHARLLDRLERSIGQLDGGPLVLDLVALWLEATGEDLGTPGVGIAQGSALSPLLSNLYLDDIDERFEARRAKLRLVRFADDFVILCREEVLATQALEEMGALLEAEGLGLKPEKTRIVTFDKGFRFLGHLFVRSMVLKSAYPDQEGGGEDSSEALLRWLGERDAEETAAEARLAAQTAAGLDPGLRVLYLRAPGRRLVLRNQAFAVEEMDTDRTRELIAIPHQRVDRIEIGPDCIAEDAAIRQALATETVIHYVNGRGETLGALTALDGNHAGLHLAQARTVLDAERRVALARLIVDARLRNQRALLQRLNRTRKDRETTVQMKDLGRVIRKSVLAEDVPALLGFEGRGAAIFWPILARTVNAGWAVSGSGGFKRQRHPAPDPFNLVLNYTAALLLRDVHTLAVRHGLHPGFGALHSANDGSAACVYDLVEEFRAPLAESLSVYLLNNRILNEDMFARRADGGWRLGREGHGPIIRAYEGWVERELKSHRTGKRLRWRRLIEEQTVAYGRHCRGEDTYRPYLMDY